MSQDYLSSVTALFQYYKSLAEGCFNQLSDKELFWQHNEAGNSIATIVQHLRGNMLSRWTDFLTADGEKEWRNRESEFENSPSNKAAVLLQWEEGWQCLFGALQGLTESDLHRIVYIRNQGHSVLEAINRQLAHYAYHVGQIVYIGKMLRNEDWSSLSIPRGSSAAFNAEKFAQPKAIQNFTATPNKKEKG